MREQQYERDRQTIGRYEIFLFGQDVAMFHTSLASLRMLDPTEALLLLEWLNHHREDLQKAASGKGALEALE